MTGKECTPKLQGVAETLIIPLYYRALETQRPDALVKDAKAVEVIGRIDYDFGRFSRLQSEQLAILVRLRLFDAAVRSFLTEHPDGVIVDIGCGLNTRFHRVDNGTLEWFDLDLPEVIVLRRQLLGEPPRCHLLAGSALDPAWMDQLGKAAGRPVLFVAEGVFPYWTEAQVKGVVLALKERFPGARLVFDATSRLLVLTHNIELALTQVQARLRFGMGSTKAMEAWAAGVRLLNTWYYFEQPEPRLRSLRLMRYLPVLGKGAFVLLYQLGGR